MHYTALSNIVQRRHPDGLTPHQRNLVREAQMWFATKLHLQPDPGTGEGLLLATEIDDEMGAAPATPGAREPPPPAGTAPKRNRIMANSPYLLKEDTSELEPIKVPDELPYSEELEQTVREFNTLAAVSEKGLEVPPVQAVYPSTDEGKWLAEMHYAIMQTKKTSQKDWHRFPVFKDYISARASGPRENNVGCS